MKKRFNYFYGDQAQLFAFYRTPKAFFQSDEYKDLSAEAKILSDVLSALQLIVHKQRKETARGWVLYHHPRGRKFYWGKK